MFEGSEHHNAGYFPPLQQAGALLNGSTNTDRTNYWEVVPTSAVDLALWMESDRMGYLLPALTRERFETQRDVVLNERRQNYENRPYGMAMMAITVGAVSARPSVSLDDDRRRPTTFGRCSSRTCRRSSAPTTIPSNASLVLAGDIDTDARVRSGRAVLRRAAARHAPDARDRRRRRSTREQRLVLEDRVELPRVYMAWHLAGDVRRRRRRDGSRWRTCWPTARRRGSIARSSTSGASRSTSRRYQSSRELGSFFLLAATAAPGQSLTEICGDDRRRAASELVGDGPDRRRDGARARPRRRRISCIACRPSADSAASPIS